MKDTKVLGRFAILSFLGFVSISTATSFSETEGSKFQMFLDETLIRFFLGLRVDVINIVAKDLTSLGSLTVSLVISVAIFAILSRFNKSREGLYLITVWLGCAVIPWVSKLAFGRARPVAENRMIVVHDLSFPSGHSFVAAAIFIALSYLHYRNFGAPKRSVARAIVRGFSLACVVGLSRIYLGVHYTTDVIGGLTLGASWALAVTLYFNARVLNRKASAETIKD